MSVPFLCRRAPGEGGAGAAVRAAECVRVAAECGLRDHDQGQLPRRRGGERKEGEHGHHEREHTDQTHQHHARLRSRPLQPHQHARIQRLQASRHTTNTLGTVTVYY